jgi:hypothetical protein
MRERVRGGALHPRGLNASVPTARAKVEDVRRLAAEGVKPVEIAARLGISRASAYRLLA